MKKIKKNIFSLLIVIPVLFLVNIFIVNAWIDPTSQAPNGNVSTPIDLGYLIIPDKLGKLGITNQDNFQKSLVIANGNFQIGTINGTEKVSVNGNIKINPGIVVATGTAITSDAVGFGSWQTVNQNVEFDLPSGAVVAFTSFCPPGWFPADGNGGRPDLRGRNIIGQGQGTGLTNRVLGSTGGEELHLIDVSFFSLFSHSHSVNGSTNDFDTGGSGHDIEYLKEDANSEDTRDMSTSPFNVMDPYSAQLYCIKD